MSICFVCKTDEELDLNVAPANAVHLFALLQVDFDCEGSIGTNDLQRKIEAAHNALSVQGIEFTRPARIAMGANGGAVIDLGLDEDRLRAYLNRLAAIAEMSRLAGIKRISWA